MREKSSGLGHQILTFALPLHLELYARLRFLDHVKSRKVPCQTGAGWGRLAGENKNKKLKLKSRNEVSKAIKDL